MFSTLTPFSLRTYISSFHPGYHMHLHAMPLTPAPAQVAQIIPIGVGSYNTQIQALNAAIPAWARGLNTTASPIWVVDQYAGFNAAADLRDGVHPNDVGDGKMLDVWYPAVMRALEAARAEMA
jgi:hypothetical protein